MKDFSAQIVDSIKKHRLFSPSDKLLVAVSGGPDSVVLLHVLVAQGYSCEAVHCNFHLRGEESDRDEMFVRRFCEELKVCLSVVDFDTKTYASQQKISIEMAARDLRYNYFEKLRQAHNLSVIAVAHHRDDSVETLLLNLVRGTGLKGLTGIHPKNGFIVRPMLQVSRKEILNYLQENELPYVTDSTNLETQFTRNKIRLQLLPLLREMNPSIEQTLQHTAENLQQASDWCAETVAEAKARIVESLADGEFSIEMKALLQEPSPQFLLYEILRPCAFTPAQVEAAFLSATEHTGAMFHSQEYDLLIDRGMMRVRRVTDKHTLREQIIEPNTTTMCRGGKLKCTLLSRNDLGSIPRDKHVAVLDAAKVHEPLVVRFVREGDKFMPFGMNGNKLVSDYMTDRKFSRFQKEEQLVVCSGNRIAWLVNERPDNRFAIEEGKTRDVIKLEWWS